MHQDILFISDLHLGLEKPDITRRFLHFLKTRANTADSLYILGDLFDAWIGDDDPTPPNNQIRKHLRELVQSGVPVFLQPGNRDFLLGQKFCKDTGVVLLDDYVVIDLFGTPTLLTHGDLLCTDDLAYQEFREKSHTDAWKSNVLSKPLLLRLLVARWYRIRSYFHKRKKSTDIMDVNPLTVIEKMSEYNCERLIHGHTHRPAIHDFSIGNISAQRYVLAAWDNSSGSVLSWNNSGYLIESI
ncbi:MAG: UDP-2,3-diacylglucosamine diphosphatase [Methylococcales bacterium]|nr:UDP-2,3-diacylglucosamine diphosphatase [Methylococcales bacterium]